jgi:hypothetical protein
MTPMKITRSNNAIQGFELFLSVWNMQQQMGTPRIHRDIAHWLSHHPHHARKRFVLQAFRGCGKSTLVGLYAAWRLMHNPDMRILVLAADQTLATKMVRMVRKVIEKHPLTQSLRPLKMEQWAADRITVQRPTVSRDPSILAAGIKSNITGMRADLIIADDVEVPKTSDTADKRSVLRQHLKELDFILTPQGEILYIGTPHAEDSIYTSFCSSYIHLTIPLCDTRGRSVWPERFPNTRIDHIREQVGPLHFASQMMLQPVALSNVRLDPQLLRAYDAPLTLREGGGESVLSIGETRMVSCACWWDPSLGKEKGDRSVIACVYTDSNGHYWLHGLHSIFPDPHLPEDPATQQAKQVLAFLRQHHALHVHIEINGLGQFLPALLTQIFQAAHYPARIIPVTAKQNKTKRIIQTLDPVLAARALHVHQSVLDHGFADDMRQFQPHHTHNRDDTLDAVCGALTAQAVRLPRLIHNAAPSSAATPQPAWQPTARLYHADSGDFSL